MYLCDSVRVLQRCALSRKLKHVTYDLSREQCIPFKVHLISRLACITKPYYVNGDLFRAFS